MEHDPSVLDVGVPADGSARIEEHLDRLPSWDGREEPHQIGGVPALAQVVPLPLILGDLICRTPVQRPHPRLLHQRAEPRVVLAVRVLWKERLAELEPAAARAAFVPSALREEAVERLRRGDFLQLGVAKKVGEDLRLRRRDVFLDVRQ